MIKYICDCCGNEIDGRRALPGNRRLCTTVKGVDPKQAFTVEVMTYLNGVANDGHFCKYCILDALYRLDDRHTSSTPVTINKNLSVDDRVKRYEQWVTSLRTALYRVLHMDEGHGRNLSDREVVEAVKTISNAALQETF